MPNECSYAPTLLVTNTNDANEHKPQHTSHTSTSTAIRIPAFLELYAPPPLSIYFDVDSYYPPPTRPQRNTRAPARYDSSQSFDDTVHEADFSIIITSTPKPKAPRREKAQTSIREHRRARKSDDLARTKLKHGNTTSAARARSRGPPRTPVELRRKRTECTAWLYQLATRCQTTRILF